MFESHRPVVDRPMLMERRVEVGILISWPELLRVAAIPGLDFWCASVSGVVTKGICRQSM